MVPKECDPRSVDDQNLGTQRRRRRMEAAGEEAGGSSALQNFVDVASMKWRIVLDRTAPFKAQRWVGTLLCIIIYAYRLAPPSLPDAAPPYLFRVPEHSCRILLLAHAWGLLFLIAWPLSVSVAESTTLAAGTL